MVLQSAAAPLPKLCRFIADRYGRTWQISPRGPLTAAEFRRLKRQYEAMVGCRVYSPEYQDAIRRGEIA